MITDNEELDMLVKIWLVSGNNAIVRGETEEKLMDISQTNQRFSREYFYSYFTAQKKTVLVTFIPGTESYLDYGSHVALFPRFSDHVEVEILNNINTGKNTYGLIHAEAVGEQLSHAASIKLANTGFSTHHVVEIHSRY